jgi:hypothetical protein
MRACLIGFARLDLNAEHLYARNRRTGYALQRRAMAANYGFVEKSDIARRMRAFQATQVVRSALRQTEPMNA